MWNRQELKARGKDAFKRNYWPCVGAAFILGIVTASSGGSARGGSDNGESFKDLFTNASEAMGISVGALIGLIVGIIGVGLVIGLVLTWFVKNPFIVGCKSFFLKNSGEYANFGCVMDGFRGNYGKVVVTMFLKGLFEFLGTILFVIPGIILAYSFRMVPYILAENPDMEATEVLKLSRSMMQGNKWNAFVLDLSFLGWILLTICTCGILGIFYVNPYIYATDAELYQAIKSGN